MASESSALLVLSMQQESIHFVSQNLITISTKFIGKKGREQQIPNKIGRSNKWIREE
jgi:hypothetical protein